MRPGPACLDFGSGEHDLRDGSGRAQALQLVLVRRRQRPLRRRQARGRAGENHGDLSAQVRKLAGLAVSGECQLAFEGPVGRTAIARYQDLIHLRAIDDEPALRAGLAQLHPLEVAGLSRRTEPESLHPRCDVLLGDGMPPRASAAPFEEIVGKEPDCRGDGLRPHCVERGPAAVQQGSGDEDEHPHWPSASRTSPDCCGRTACGSRRQRSPTRPRLRCSSEWRIAPHFAEPCAPRWSSGVRTRPSSTGSSSCISRAPRTWSRACRSRSSMRSSAKSWTIYSWRRSPGCWRRCHR